MFDLIWPLRDIVKSQFTEYVRHDLVNFLKNVLVELAVVLLKGQRLSVQVVAASSTEPSVPLDCFVATSLPSFVVTLFIL